MKKMVLRLVFMLGAILEACMFELGLIKGFAKIKFGQIISEARGKMAGMVFSRNKYGSYARQKVSPVQPRTVAQVAVRSGLTAASQAWSALTEAVRLQYNSMVGQFKKTNIFGDAQTITGFNLFCMFARNAQAIGSAIPSTFTGLTNPVGISTLAVVSEVTIPLVELTYAPVIPATEEWLLLATAPQSAGKKFVKSEFRQIRTLLAADVSPVDVTAAYVAKFGAVPAIGQKVFVKIIPIQNVSFNRGSELSATTIAVAG